MILTPEEAHKKTCPVILAALIIAGKDAELLHKARCKGTQCMNWEWHTDEYKTLEWKDFDFVKKNEPRISPDAPDSERQSLWSEYMRKVGWYIKKWDPPQPKGEGWTLKETTICKQTGAPLAIWTKPVFNRKGRCAAQNLQWVLDKQPQDDE